MKISILDQSFEMTNEVSTIEELLNKIKQIFLDNSDLYFSHMIIDGQEVYASFEDYILEHLSDIQEVTIYSSTVREFRKETLISIEQYIRNAIPELNQLADQFYKGENNEVWHKFDQFLEGLQWIFDTVSIFSQNILDFNHSKEYKIYSDKIKEHIIALQQAQENHDLVLIADLINFEIVPFFKELHELVNQTIDNEVMHDDIS